MFSNSIVQNKIRNLQMVQTLSKLWGMLGSVPQNIIIKTTINCSHHHAYLPKKVCSEKLNGLYFLNIKVF